MRALSHYAIELALVAPLDWGERRRKDGLVQRDVEELAAVVVEALRPLLIGWQARDRTKRLHEAGVLAPPLTVDPNDW